MDGRGDLSIARPGSRTLRASIFMRLVQTGISAALTGTPNQSSCALLASMPFMEATCSVSLQACMKPRQSARLQETSAFSRLQHMLPHRRDFSAASCTCDICVFIMLYGQPGTEIVSLFPGALLAAEG